MSGPIFFLKRAFFKLFLESPELSFGDMFFRWYNPTTDIIVDSYDDKDWNSIFKNWTENDLQELNDYANVIILLWCDKNTKTPRGMLYLEESYSQAYEVSFHGGTWDHSDKYFYGIFQSLVGLFLLLLKYGYTIKTTCGIENYKADRFQNKLCFEETYRDHEKICKTMNKKKFLDSDLVRRFKTDL